MGEPATPTAKDRAETRALAARVVQAVRTDSSIAEALGFSRHTARYEAENIEPILVDMAQEIEMLSSQLAAARRTAIAYAHQVNQLGLAADDNDPKVMATAGPIGVAQSDLWDALGILIENPPCGFGLDGGDCFACGLGKNKEPAR